MSALFSKEENEKTRVRGQGRVDEDLLAVPHFHHRLLPGDLLCNQGRYVGLEHAGTETHDDDCDAEKTDDSAVRRANVRACQWDSSILLHRYLPLVDDSGNRTNDQEDVADQDDNVGH